MVGTDEVEARCEPCRHSRLVVELLKVVQTARGKPMYRILLVISLSVFSSSSQAKELTLGLIPEQNVFEQVARHKPLQDYLASKTGMDVKLTMLSRYGNIIDYFARNKLDGAFWGSFTGAMAIKKLGVEPIARPLWLDGSSTYRGYIFVKKSGKIRDVADMRGKTVAFVERATTAGYVFSLAYFREHGVTEIESYFKEIYFTGSHDAAIRAVLNGEADIGTAKNTIFDLVARADPRVTKDLIVLAQSPKVPSNGLGLRKTLEPEIKRQLKNVLLEMDRDKDGVGILKTFGALKFIATAKEDYNPVFDIARKAGIDVEQYSYVNQ
jgi:phosphonate transport system substrate-binding protein